MSGAAMSCVIQLPESPDMINLIVMQEVIQSTVTSVGHTYVMKIKVDLMHTLKSIREKLATAENLKGWPLPTNGYSFRRQPRPDNINDDGVDLIEGGGRTFRKLGVKDGDTILVVPSDKVIMTLNITGMGMDAIPVNVRPSDKVRTLREKLQRLQIQNLPPYFRFTFGRVVMEDDIPIELYNLRQGARIRVTPKSAPHEQEEVQTTTFDFVSASLQ